MHTKHTRHRKKRTHCSFETCMHRCELTDKFTCALQNPGFQVVPGWQRAWSRLSLEKSMKADRPFLGASARAQLRQGLP